MPSWEQAPRPISELLNEYVGSTYPGTSLAFDAGGRTIHIQNDGMSDADFQSMMNDLQAKFPGAF